MACGFADGTHNVNPYEGAYEITQKDQETLTESQLKLLEKAVTKTHEIWGYNPFLNEHDGKGFQDIWCQNRRRPISRVSDILRTAYGFTRESETNRRHMYMEGGDCLYVIQPDEDGFKLFGELVNAMQTTAEKWRKENKLSSLLKNPEDGSFSSRKVLEENIDCPLFYDTRVIVRPIEELEIPYSVRTKLGDPGLPIKYVPVYIGFTCSRSVQLIMMNNVSEKRIIYRFAERYAELRSYSLYYSVRNLFEEMHASIVRPFIQKLSDNNRWRWERHLRRTLLLHRAGVRKTRRLGR